MAAGPAPLTRDARRPGPHRTGHPSEQLRAGPRIGSVSVLGLIVLKLAGATASAGTGSNGGGGDKRHARSEIVPRWRRELR